MSSSANTRVVEVRETGLRSYEVSPEDVGLRRSALSAVAGGSPEANADVVRRVLAGERGPHRDIAVLNAGAAIYVGADEGTLEEGVRSAEAAIDDGRAAAVLERLVAFTSSVAAAR
jgi:anthranilate phosphoribosyltransferase